MIAVGESAWNREDVIAVEHAGRSRELFKVKPASFGAGDPETVCELTVGVEPVAGNDANSHVRIPGHISVFHADITSEMSTRSTAFPFLRKTISGAAVTLPIMT